jgi:Fic family protein
VSTFAGFGSRLDPVPADLARRLGRIDRAAGQSDLYRQQLPRLLEALRDRARVESVEASSAIEGIVVPHARAEAVVRDPSEAPRNRSEAELRGYSNALDHVFEMAPAEKRLTVGLVLHLHRLLFEIAGAGGAGQFKTSDNIVIDRDAGAQRHVRFTPVAASATPQAVSNLVDIYEDVSGRATHHPLVLIAAFVLDFTVIHPFADGNGRVSRLLTGLLLERAGYDVGRYVSVERQTERTKDRYYATLLASTAGWHDGTHDPWPWATYFVETIEAVYERFIQHADAERTRGSKQERVRRHLEQHAGRRFSMEDLRVALPGISDATVRVVLNELRAEGRVTATTGRGAQWTWIGGARS